MSTRGTAGGRGRSPLGGSGMPPAARVVLTVFLVVIFAAIAWVLLLYPAWQSWREWTALHSENALRGRFVAERCESSATRYGLNTTCYGEFTADEEAGSAPVEYAGTAPVGEPLPAARLPGADQVWLVENPRYENRLKILTFVLTPLLAWAGWRLLRRRAAASA